MFNIFVQIFIVRLQPSGGAFVHCGGGQEQVGPKQGQVRSQKDHNDLQSTVQC